MNKILLTIGLLLGLVGFLPAQTHTFPANDTTNIFTGDNTFSTGPVIGGCGSATGCAFANLPVDGIHRFVYCTDCQQVNPALGGGSGAMCRFEAGTWDCGGGGGGGGGTDTHLSNLAAPVAFPVDLVPSTAATRALGSQALPMLSVIIGSAANHSATITGTFTANRTWTIPDANDTAVGVATTTTFTNKTFDTGGTGNVFKVAGTQITALSGTGGTLATNAGPTFSGTVTQTGTFDATGAAHTKPNKTDILANIPVSCVAGETFTASDQTTGNFYNCGSDLVFHQVGPSTPGSPGSFVMNVSGSFGAYTGLYNDNAGNTVHIPHSLKSDDAAGFYLIGNELSSPMPTSGSATQSAIGINPGGHWAVSEENSTVRNILESGTAEFSDLGLDGNGCSQFTTNSLYLCDISAGVFGIHNTTSGARLNVYGTFPTNSEMVSLGWSSGQNAYILATDKNSSGGYRQLCMSTHGFATIIGWCITTSGNFIASGGNTAPTIQGVSQMNAARYAVTNTAGGASFTPTCTFTTGGATSPSCTFNGNSTDSAGTILATVGATGSPGSTGVITLTFSSTLGGNAPSCWASLNDNNTAWAGRAVAHVKTASLTSVQITWDNNSTLLINNDTYGISYGCIAQ